MQSVKDSSAVCMCRSECCVSLVHFAMFLVAVTVSIVHAVGVINSGCSESSFGNRAAEMDGGYGCWLDRPNNGLMGSSRTYEETEARGGVALHRLPRSHTMYPTEVRTYCGTCVDGRQGYKGLPPPGALGPCPNLVPPQSPRSRLTTHRAQSRIHSKSFMEL